MTLQYLLRCTNWWSRKLLSIIISTCHSPAVTLNCLWIWEQQRTVERNLKFVFTVVFSQSVAVLSSWSRRCVNVWFLYFMLHLFDPSWGSVLSSSACSDQWPPELQPSVKTDFFMLCGWLVHSSDCVYYLERPPHLCGLKMTICRSKTRRFMWQSHVQWSAIIFKHMTVTVADWCLLKSSLWTELLITWNET